MKSRNYVNDELVHWTGRGKPDKEAFEILRTICDEETLRLSYCPNYVSPDFEKKSSMVCFTDIPLKHSREHCRKFGRVGIGFKKSSMIQYGANPVLYTTGIHFDRIKLIGSLLDRMKDMEKDREWRQEMESYIFTEDETLALLEVTEFLQEYAYKNQDLSDYVTYYQREWRLAFRSLPFAGDRQPQLPGMSCIYIREGQSHLIFKFARVDVEFIVVPIRFWFKAREIAKYLGCKLKIYEFVVGA